MSASFDMYKFPGQTFNAYNRIYTWDRVNSVLNNLIYCVKLNTKGQKKTKSAPTLCGLQSAGTGKLNQKTKQLSEIHTCE